VSARDQQLRRNNRCTALVLVSIAALFFAIVIIKYSWLMR
jgi:hypothetical protein